MCNWRTTSRKRCCRGKACYGPFLRRAEACKSRNSNAEADALFIGADEVNAAHLAAPGWAHSVQV